TAQHLLSSDQRLEGAQIGDRVVLFGRDGDVDLATPVSYQVTGNGLVQQLVTNLEPGVVYQVQADGAPLPTVTASAQGTIVFATSGSGTQTITICKAS